VERECRAVLWNKVGVVPTVPLPLPPIRTHTSSHAWSIPALCLFHRYCRIVLTALALYRLDPIVAFRTRSSLTLLDKRQNHPVEVVEEAEQVEAQLEEALSFVPAQRAEDLRRIVHVVLLIHFVRVV